MMTGGASRRHGRSDSRLQEVDLEPGHESIGERGGLRTIKSVNFSFPLDEDAHRQVSVLSRAFPRKAGGVEK